MLYRVLFFLIFSQSFSQLKIDSIYDYKLIELNNIGTVFNSHFPNFDFDIIDVNYNIIGSRLVENYHYNLLYNNINIIPISNITSNLSYISSYNEGGLIMCNLQRPMSKKSFINFYYNNLSSKGFFQYQENKFSNLGLEFYSFNQDTTYRFQFGFNSINGFYKENGGIQSYNSNLSNDLLSTYLNSATIENQIRNFLFSHIFEINSKNSIRHTFKYNRYNRLYNDPNPTSFHYSMTPLSYQILSDFSRYTYFNDIENSLHFNSDFFFKKKIDYSLIHRLYYNDLIVNKKYGDFIFSVSNLNNNLSKYNFSVSFCPIGYNKNNYDFRFYYKFDYNESIKNKFSISLNKQKPNLFLENYDTGLSTDWENDFAPTNVFSIHLETYLSKYNFDIKLNYKKISDLLYYNNIAAPVQFNESIKYLHFHLKKDWFLNRLRINHNIHFQKVKHNDSNFDIIPVPVFLLNQKVTYDFSLFKKIDFSSSFDLTLFSKYYANSYMPINGVFYNQNELKIGGRPLLQASLFMKKKNFNIGVLVENIHSLFFDELYIIPDYIYNDLVFRLSLDWRFLD